MVDTVVNVREDRGGLMVRLGAMTVTLPPGVSGAREIRPGSRIGVQAAPEDVRVLDLPLTDG
jgi:hypothetical protein